MGLDQYLRVRQYVSGYRHQEKPEQEQYAAILDALGLTPGDVGADSTPSLYIEINVAYWRKANMIHNWFVQNHAGGVDNCEPVRVERGALEELRDTCQHVLDVYEGKHPELVWAEVAREVMPPVEGFFFGSTDLDEYYVADLRDTVKQLDRVLGLKSFEHADFIYEASW